MKLAGNRRWSGRTPPSEFNRWRFRSTATTRSIWPLAYHARARSTPSTSSRSQTSAARPRYVITASRFQRFLLIRARRPRAVRTSLSVRAPSPVGRAFNRCRFVPRAEKKKRETKNALLGRVRWPGFRVTQHYILSAVTRDARAAQVRNYVRGMSSPETFSAQGTYVCVCVCRRFFDPDIRVRTRKWPIEYGKNRPRRRGVENFWKSQGSAWWTAGNPARKSEIRWCTANYRNDFPVLRPVAAVVRPHLHVGLLLRKIGFYLGPDNGARQPVFSL